MKKTLVALALASLPAAAMADVVLYGQIKGGVEVSADKKIEGTEVGKGTSTQIVDYGSRIGFKGHEDLKNGMQVIWQLEQSVNVAGGEGTRFGNRDSFIGLKSKKVGAVKVGNQGTPLFNTFDLDNWNYVSEAGGLSQFGRSTHLSKRALGISYETPDLSGFSATAYVSPSENNNGETYGYRKQGDEAVYGLSAHYKNAGFFADVAAGYVSKGLVNQNKSGSQVLGQVGYGKDKWGFGVAYQNVSNVETQLNYLDTDLVDGKVERATYELPSGENAYTGGIYETNEVAATATYKPNKALTLKASVAHGFNGKHYDARVDEVTKTNATRYVQGVVGADYALTNRTTVNGQVGYIQFGKGKNNSTGTGVVGVGLKHKF